MIKTLQLKLVLLLCMIMGAGTAWAVDPDETVDFSAQGYSNQQAIESYKGTDFTVSFNKGTNNSNAPKYYTSGTAIRAYGGNYFTVSSTTKTIEKIVITFGSSDGSNEITTDEVTYANGTWEGSASSVKFTIGGTSGNRRIKGLSIYYESSGGGGSNAVATTTTIDDSGITNTDVYVDTDAGSLSATVNDNNNAAISGATVTWSGNNDAVATIDASTGEVTLVSAGTVTFTASYAGESGTYQSSSDTYEMTVTDSSPFTGGDVMFDATKDKGTSPLEKNTVTFACDNGVLNNGSEYRLYKNSTTTFSVSQGVITSIVFTGVSSYPASGFGTQAGWTTDGNNGTWTGSANSVSFTASGAQVRATQIVVTVDLQGTADPSFTISNNNEIAYDATSGSFDFTVNNLATNGSVSVSENVDWISNAAVSGNSVTFTTTANEATTSRSGVITLTYTYDTNKTVTKEVTVTQAGNPNNTITTIPDLFAAATSAGSTATNVNVTFGNWVVSGVNGSNVFVTDNNGNGFIIYTNNHGFAVNDILSGTVSGTPLKLYNGSAEFTSLTASDLTVTPGGTVTAANIAMASLAGVNTGALVSYQNLTCSVNNSKYYLSDGTTTLQVYSTLYDFGSLTAGNTYNITGVYQQFNSTKEILPRSAADIVEVTVTTPSISADDVNIAADATSGEIVYTISNPDGSTLTAAAAASDTWITNVTVDATNSKVIFNTTPNSETTAREGTITLTYGSVSKDVTVTQAAASVTGSPTLTNANIVDAGDPATSYGSWTITDTNGKTWNAFAIKNKHSNATSAYHYLQIKKYASSTAYYLQVPEYGTKITSLTMTVSGSNQPMDGGSNGATLYFSADNTTSESGDGVVSGTGASTVTIDCSSLNLNTGYITASGAVRIWDVTVEYETSSSETVTITIKANFPATTFSTNKALDFTNVTGITAYIITDENGSTSKVTKVPANTGLYIEATTTPTSALEVVVPVYTGTEFSSTTYNKLIATTAGTTYNTGNGTTYYAYGHYTGNSQDKYAFMKIGGNGLTPGAGKALLCITGSNAKDIIDVNGGATSIDNTEWTIDNSGANGIYDLQGRRVVAPTKGIYIVNGRKVVIK